MTKKYKTGYKKPPKSSQFAPGQSGNPKGRPKGAKNARTILSEMMTETINISVNGEHKIVSKLEAMMTQLTNKALSGDIKAQAKILSLLDENEAAEHSKDLSSFNSEADKQLMKSIKERYKNATK